jgi:ATP-binding cassette subfamily C (CFTR/MRP) protein 4
LGVIDETLPPVVFDTFEIFLQTLGVIFIVSSSSPVMLLPATLMGILFFFIRRFYFRTARAIKRLEGLARSPVFSHLSTTLTGLTTIRAFRAQEMFERQFERNLDIHSSVWYLFLASSRWLGIVIDWISILFVSSVLINFLVDVRGDAVVGLAVTSAMMLTR